ncbi:MAG: DUF3617 domain-containing protein [Novosphingobium sp.]|nr:DUF3617 domain-containing protein [Novosphingobium sp.]
MTRSIRLASISVLVTGALAVSACGGGDTIEAENESVEAVAEKVAKADVRPNPGRWESKMKIVKMELPGLPAEAQGMMKSQLGKVTTSASCLTKEEAEKSEQDLFMPPKTSDCKYNSFSMGGGKLEADMTCQENGSAQAMKMSGTYSENAYAMQVSADGKIGDQAMSMAMEVESKRVGDCDGSEEG